MGGIVEKVESDVKRMAEAADVDGAVTRALEGYGHEILEWLSALHKSEADAADAFSLFAEGLWRGLPRFEWKCTLRTWMYAIARRCSLRLMRDGRRRRAHEARLPEGSNASVLVARMRTRTASFLMSERRRVAIALRASLSPEDQALLMLRVDRGLAFNELAHVLHEGDGDALDEADVPREAARLRKRFQLIKDKLRSLAQRDGLLAGPETQEP